MYVDFNFDGNNYLKKTAFNESQEGWYSTLYHY